MSLKLENISFSFVPSTPILENINIEFEQGKIYALMGANGAGKSTLFNIITGFIKAKAGKIFLNNTNINKKKAFQINRLGIGRTFQDLRIINTITVFENVLLCIKGNPFDKWYNTIFQLSKNIKIENEFKVEANEIISKYHLIEVKDKLAGELSYGQLKLLNIACCEANNASIMLLDEPVSGVNPIYREQIIQFLKEIKEKNKTIIIIEHNPEFISQVVDEIIFLSHGKTTIYDDIKALREDNNVIENYL